MSGKVKIMIYVDSRLKYMFDKMPVQCIEHDEKTFRVDMMVYETFKSEELAGLSKGDWDLIYIDGDIENAALNNLELVVFKDEKFFKENKVLREQMIAAKRNSEEKEKIAKEALSERTVNRIKIDSLTKQVAYEQKRVTELNKELNKKEKEIRRLMDVIESTNRR